MTIDDHPDQTASLKETTNGTAARPRCPTGSQRDRTPVGCRLTRWLRLGFALRLALIVGATAGPSVEVPALRDARRTHPLAAEELDVERSAGTAALQSGVAVAARAAHHEVELIAR